MIIRPGIQLSVPKFCKHKARHVDCKHAMQPSWQWTHQESCIGGFQALLGCHHWRCWTKGFLCRFLSAAFRSSNARHLSPCMAHPKLWAALNWQRSSCLHGISTYDRPDHVVVPPQCTYLFAFVQTCHKMVQTIACSQHNRTMPFS